MKTDDPHACRWCGDPLPDRQPGQRGRPRVAHPGDCARQDRNRRGMNNRAAAFRAAQRPDPSDTIDTPGYGVDPGDLADGWTISRGGYWDSRPIPAPVLERWEADRRAQRLMNEHERQEIAAEVDTALSGFYALPDADRVAYLRAAVARRSTRH